MSDPAPRSPRLGPMPHGMGCALALLALWVGIGAMLLALVEWDGLPLWPNAVLSWLYIPVAVVLIGGFLALMDPR